MCPAVGCGLVEAAGGVHRPQYVLISFAALVGSGSKRLVVAVRFGMMW